MPVRKNVATLSAFEIGALTAAILALKKSKVYDKYVLQHSASMRTATPWKTEKPDPFARNVAHGGPAFLPWHREFLRRFEKDLGVPLPYWDWAADQASGSPKTAKVWSESIMGPNGDPVTEHVLKGKFAHDPANPDSWSTIQDPALPKDPSIPWLTRNFGVMTMDDGSTMPLDLPMPAAVTSALALTPYDADPWDHTSSGFRNTLEGWNGPDGMGLHNRAHMWVGGSMMPSTSPNDPVFWLHHANVDRIWANWQRKWPKQGYLPVTGGPTGHNLKDPMLPWGGTTTPESVLDTFALGYWYDDAPSPVVNVLIPNKGATTGGVSVLITGAGFLGATSVKFGAVNATSFKVLDDTQITATCPAGNGTVDVIVTSPVGTSPRTPLDLFAYSAATPTPVPTPHPPTPTPHPPTPTPTPHGPTPTPTPHPPTPSSGAVAHAGFPFPQLPRHVAPAATPQSLSPEASTLPSGGNAVAIAGVVGIAAVMGMVAAAGIVAVVAIAGKKDD